MSRKRHLFLPKWLAAHVTCSMRPFLPDRVFLTALNRHFSPVKSNYFSSVALKWKATLFHACPQEKCPKLLKTTWCLFLHAQVQVLHLYGMCILKGFHQHQGHVPVFQTCQKLNDRTSRNTRLQDVPVLTEVLVCVICQLRTVGSELGANNISPKSSSTAAAKTWAGCIH